MCTNKAGSRFEAFTQQKCPRCRRGKMFTHRFYHLSKFQEMHAHCPVCGVSFEPETGFYWGAMYISYAITVAISVTVGVGIRIFYGPGLNINVYIAAIISTMLLFVPVSFRVSRAIMLHFISPVKYDPNFEWDGKILEDDDRID